MESPEDFDQEKGIKEPLITQPIKAQGGVRTLPFILANEGFERAAYFGLQPNMIVYLMAVYGLDMATGSNIIFFWSAASSFAPILGAFMADSYVGRYQMIGIGSIFSVLGTTLLWSTTIIPGVSPSCYNTSSNSCTSSTLVQLMYLCSALGLMSIGAGGIRSSTLAFGADQLLGTGDGKAKPDSSGILQSFFNWYYFSVTFAVLFALTCVVYIQDHMGWQAGFAVPVMLMLFSAISFFLASSFYVKVKPQASLVTRFAQVLVALWKNRHYKFSSPITTETVYHVAKGTTITFPSDKLKFLNKACIVKDPVQDLTPDGMALDPWSLCTVDQIEEFKSIVKIIPLWSTGIMLCVNSNQTSFLVLQAISMDRHMFTSSFEIPPGSFGTFALVSLMLWLVLYDRLIVPLASKAMGKPVRLDVKTRMGIGLLFSFLQMVVSGVVESVRRERAMRGGTSIGGASSIAPMSALWLVPQLCLLGLAEGFTAIAQIEFSYSELPKTMSSISSNLYGLSYCVASLAASLIMSVVNHVTKQGGNESWISSDLNKGHYDYYYYVLAGLSLLNCMYFLLCNRLYGQEKKVSEDKKEFDDR